MFERIKFKERCEISQIKIRVVATLADGLEAHWTMQLLPLYKNMEKVLQFAL